MNSPQAINSGDITKLGIGITVALVILGVLLGLLITAIIGRLLIALVVIALGVFVWVQRGSIEHDISQHVCPPSLSFFGFHVDAPQSLKHYCHTHRSH